MKTRSLFLFSVIVSAFLLLYCSSSEKTTIADQDVTGSSTIKLEEKEMKAAVADGRVDFTIVLHNVAGRPVSGRTVLTLLKIADDGTESSVATASGRFEMSGSSAEQKISLSYPEITKQANLASFLLSYNVDGAGGALHGRKSLYDAVEKIEAVFMSPDKFISGEKARMRLLVRDPATGAPRKNHPFRVILKKDEAEREMASGRTGENGSAEIEGDVESGDEGSGNIQVFVGEGDTAELIEGTITVTRSQKILLTTDKPIYQPGQLMHLRTLALRRPDLRPDAGRSVLVEVLDAKGNKVFKKSLQTDQYGIAYTTFRLASEVIMGRYTIRAAMDDTVTEKAVTVDRYVLPKFKVDFSTERQFYMPGETVNGAVEARYFFGKATAGATVDISAKTFDVELTEFATASGVTDENGHWDFSIELPDYFAGLPLDQGDAYLQFDVTVTDLAEHKEKLSKTAVVSQSPISIQVIPEAGDVVTGIANLFYILTTDPTGAPLETSCAVRSGDSTIDVGTDRMGIGAFEATPAEAEIAIEVTATDEGGREAVKSFSFTPGSTASDGFVLVRTDKSLYKAGETVAIQVLTDASQERVYLDVIQNLRTVLTKTLPVENGKAVWGLDLDEGMTGTIEIYAYVLAKSSNIMRCRKIVWVDPANELTVSTRLDKEVYRPAENTTIEFNVTDAAGAPKPAAIGLQIVDEAVFALTEFRPGLEKTFFNIESEVMKPRYQIKGYSTGAVIDEEQPREDREEVAKVLFSAASGGGAYPIEVNTYRRGLEAAMKVLGAYIDKDVGEILQGLYRLVQDGVITRENYKTWINAHKAGWIDPFGQSYDVFFKDYEVAGDDSGYYDEYYKDYYIVFESRGMDETAGTADDVEVRKSRDELMYAYDRNDRWGGMEDGEAGPPSPNAGPGGEEPADNDNHEQGKSGNAQTPYVRSFFPETLYVNPAVITDGSGRASLSLPLADSITTWRMSMLASSLDGRLGSASAGIRVFQPFFIDIDFPAALTRNDEISAPVAVFNYLEEAQSVRLEIEMHPWFRLDDSAVKTVDLEAGEVTVVYFRIKALNVGLQPFTVYGYGSEMSDAIERRVRVVPDGREVVANFSDRLAGHVSKTITIPEEAIDGASKIFVKLYPGVFAQAVEGLDSMLQVPYG